MKLPDAEVTGLTALRAVDPARARTVNALLTLIAASADPLRIDARSGDPGAATAWFATDAGHWFAIIGINETVPMIARTRVDDSLHALAAADRVLVQLEARLGLSFEPVDIVDAPAPHAITIAATTPATDGATAAPPFAQRIAMLIAFDPDALDASALDQAAQACVPAAADCPIICQVKLAAPLLTIEQATALDRGDMVVIGSQTPARIEWHGGIIGGVAALSTGQFIADTQKGEAMASSASRSGAPRNPGGFGVALTIALPPRTVSIATLGHLRPGMTVPIGAMTAGLAVELQVAGRAIAFGEIVQLGDQFAVMIDERADLSDMADAAAPDQQS